jgi:hypothetical protein
LLPLVFAACTSDDPESETPPLPSSYTFNAEAKLSGAANVRGDLSNCTGAGQFADMYKTAPVTVTDVNLKPIAVGSLLDGLGTNVFQNVLDECTFRFVVRNVPSTGGYYVIVGRQRPKAVARITVQATNGRFQIEVNTPNVPRGPSPLG